MIKDGNYYFLDYEKYRESFIDILIEYYGKEHEETIRNRMNKVVYIPYMTYDNVIDYYSQDMTRHSDEIYSAFEEFTGYKLTDEMKKLVWEDGGSMIFTANKEGENLTQCEFFLNKEYYQILVNARKKVCEAFGITAENPVPEIQKLCRQVKKALRVVADNHPNQVNRDVEKFISNKNELLQKYLTYVSKYFLSMTDRDIEIVNNPDFDTYDLDNLDCRYLFFDETISEPGLVAGFTSQSQSEMINGTLDDKIKILCDRVEWFVLNNESADCLKYITKEELFNEVEVADKEDFINRLIKEQSHQMMVQPGAVISMQAADAIETNRKFLAETQYFGCRFAQNLNKSWDGDVHSASSKDQWITTMGYYRNSVDEPINTIFFNEDTKQSAESLLGSLIHENNHAVSFGEAVISKNQKRAYGRYGLVGQLLKIDKDHIFSAKYILPEHKRILAIEENVNERMAKEITEMYIAKYGIPFEECDIPNSYRKEKSECLYDCWNFLTEKFYKYYREDLKHTRVTEGKKFFFDNDGLPAATKVESMFDYVKAQYNKRVNPLEFDDNGFLSYTKVAKLGRIIEQFQKNIVPILEENPIPLNELNEMQGEHYDALASNVKMLINSLHESAEKIVDSMIEDSIEKKIRAMTRTTRKAEIKSAIESLVSVGRKKAVKNTDMNIKPGRIKVERKTKDDVKDSGNNDKDLDKSMSNDE